FLLSTISAHSPDLHRPAAFGIEIDELAVRRIIRSIVEARGGGEARLGAARDGNGVDIKFLVALGTVNEGLRVRRPSVPIGWSEGGEAGGYPAGGRHHVNKGMPLL